MTGFLVALQFLTILPVKLNRRVEEKLLGRSLFYFPIVGLFLGASLVILNRLLLLIFPQRLTNLCLVAFLLLLTGGIHIDGLADTADAFFSGKDRKEMLKIMRDSRIGAFGAIAVSLLILSKWELLSDLPPTTKDISLFLMPFMGRSSLVMGAYLLPYARSSPGLAKSFTEYVRRRDFLFSLALFLILPVLFLGPYGLILSLSILGLLFLLVKYLKYKIGGTTGDTLGAVNEVMEISTLLVMVLLVKIWGETI